VEKNSQQEEKNIRQVMAGFVATIEEHNGK